MNDQGRILATTPSMNDEEWGTSQELLTVRRALLATRKLECPVGFEFRLQRRIDGASLEHPASPVRLWSLGWAGVGLGFAAAVLVGVLAFDLNMTDPVGVQVAGSIQVPSTDPAGSTVQTTSDQLAKTEEAKPSAAGKETDPAAAAKGKRDTLPESKPTQLPEGLYQVVGGSGH